MKKKVAEFTLIAIYIFVSSYFLNFVWESFHAVLLYEHHDFDAKKYVFMVSYVSAVDGVLILGIYLLISFLWRDIFWLREMNRKHVYTSFVVGLVVAAIIEYIRVVILKTWSYNPIMPTIFGIGLSPLLQLSLTGLMAYWLTHKILCHFNDN